MSFFRSGGALVAAAFCCGSAFAAPITSTSFDVTSAVSDDLHGANHNHSVWLPFFENIAGTPLFGNSEGSDFDFVPAGLFVVNSDGAAQLSGRIVSQVNSDFSFDVVFDFSLRDGPGSGGPKLELLNSAYSANGGPIDPSTWSFFDLVSGTFTGANEFTGIDFLVSQFPADGRYPLQAGDGANNKNGNHGLSVWFLLALDDNNNFCDLDFCTLLRDFGQLRGDVNVDINEVPLPAGFILFGSGLAGLAAARKAKKRNA